MITGWSPAMKNQSLQKVRLSAAGQNKPEVPGCCHGDECLDAGQGHRPIVGGVAAGCVHLVQTEAVQGTAQTQEYPSSAKQLLW